MIEGYLWHDMIPGLMQAYPGINHENYGSLTWKQAAALTAYFARQQKRQQDQ